MSKLAGKVDFERFGKWDERAESGGLWRGVIWAPVLLDSLTRALCLCLSGFLGTALSGSGLSSLELCRVWSLLVLGESLYVCTYVVCVCVRVCM